LTVAACLLLPAIATAQDLMGTLIGTVKDEQGGVLAGARVRISSPALIGGPETLITGDKGQLRFPSLPPGLYALAIELQGFAPYHEDELSIGAGATIERTAVLKVAGLAESVAVEGAGSRIEARSPGFGTRFGLEDINAIPTRRASMFDFIRAAPGVSPTSPSSGVATTISVFGSGTNENLFLIDGLNTTCPCSGIARSEPGVDFIQEVQIHAIGASAQFGNMQGGVISVVTKQGSERFLFDASHFGQSAALTSQPITLTYLGSQDKESGYGRAKYRDFTSSLGGPAVRDRLWFFGGYQRLRDHDSQPGTDPKLARTYEMQKLFVKLTWRLAPGWQLVQSFHDEVGIDPERSTIVTPFEATARTRISAPAMTFGNLTHTQSTNTLWDVRVGRFTSTRHNDPSTGSLPASSRFDRVTGVTTGVKPIIGSVAIFRTTAMGMLTHYRRALGGEHQWKIGGQFERGEHHAINMIPTGVRFEDRGGQPLQRISSLPAHVGVVCC
jgi:Carboxypeptidase regulatory-like domain/TonB-dependent Receptor Plug Domain